MLFAHPAHAQLLNLDSAKPPQPGEGKALMSLSESLQPEVRRLQRDLQRSGDELEKPGIAFRLALRRLIVALVDHAETIGEPASPHALAALHLSASIRDLDALASGSRKDEEQAAELRLALQKFAEETGDEPAIPADAEALDELLRDRFAIIVQLQSEQNSRARWVADPGRCGWLETSLPGERQETPDLAPLIERLRKHAAVDDAAPGKLATFNELLALADRWYIHRHTARDLRLTLADAALILEPAPDSLSESAHTKLVHRYADAAADFTEKQHRPTARAALHDLHRFALLLDRLADLSPPRSHADSMREAVASLADAVQSGSASATGRLRSAETALALLGQRASLGDDRGVARELRPGWRVLSGDAERTEDALYAAFPRLAAAANATTDPALASVVSAHRRALDDLRALRTISQWLGDWLQPGMPGSPLNPTPPSFPGRPDLPTDSAPRRLAAARVLSLCQSLSREDEKAQALETLRQFAADLRDLAQLPAEEDLGAARTGPWNQLTGDRAVELAARIALVRERWLTAWATEGSGRDTGEDPAQLAAELRTLERLTAALSDGAAILNLASAVTGGGFFASSDPGLLAHAGAGLSDRAILRLREDVRTALPKLTAAVLARSGDGSARVQQYAGDHVVHALIAALHRACAERDGVACPRWILAALPRPVSGRIWLGDSEADLAAISRYLEEYTHAQAEGESAFARELLTYLNIRARDLLQEIDLAGEKQRTAGGN